MEKSSISQSELDVLKVLWDIGRGTVREVWDEMPDERWVYSTVQTLLQRLEAKGVVASTKQGRLRVYVPAVSREELVRQRLGRLSRDLCDGARLPLMQGLVEGQLTPEELREMRALLDEAEAKGRRKRR